MLVKISSARTRKSPQVKRYSLVWNKD